MNSPRAVVFIRTAGLTALLALSAAAAACFHFGGTIPPVELYRLSWPADSAGQGTTPLPARDPGAARAPALQGAVTVSPYVTPGVYGSGAIVYRVEGQGYGSYANREWAIPLGEMLGAATAPLLDAAGLASGGAAYQAPSGQPYLYRWHGAVREFEEVDHDRTVNAVVALDARIVRTSDDSVLWSGSRRLERPVPDGTMPSIVSALSELARDAISSLAEEARVAVAQPARADSSAPPPKKR